MVVKKDIKLENDVQEKSKFLTVPKIILLIVTVFLIILKILLEVHQLRFINSFVNYIIIGFIVTAIIILIIMFVKYKTKKLWLVKLIMVIVIIIALISIPYIMVMLYFEDEVYHISQSPLGRNRVVVFEGGYIAAIYTAYPVKYNIFYQKQDNEYVFKNDFWGGADIEVEWKTENIAFVKVITGDVTSDKEAAGDYDIIVVSFLNEKDTGN